jgi:acetate kinase
MREVLSRAGAGDEAATLALEVYLHRLCRGIGAMAAALDGVDALVFTGGVGENSAEIRARAVAGLGFLGLAIDGRRNARCGGNADVPLPEARTRALVLRAREDLEIARQVRTLLHAARPIAAEHGRASWRAPDARPRQDP